MTIAAIPTQYKGIQFRSRLEARWAAFFDLCGWEWAYEPIDLPGYIPDFFIYPENRSEPILIEVKPISKTCPDTVEKVINALIGQSHVTPRCIILCGLTPIAGKGNARSIGWIYQGLYLEAMRSGGERRFLGANWWTPTRVIDRHGRLSFLSQWNRDGITGDIPQYVGTTEDVGAQIDAWWIKAGNAVQYKRPQ